MSVQVSSFGFLPDGREAHLYTMTAPDGASVSVTDFGARLTSIRVPDRNGRLGEVCIGFDTVLPYALPHGGSVGSTVGRVANRIGGARFFLNGHEYKLPVNDGVNTLHSGPDGFCVQLWDGEALPGPEGDSVAFRLLSPDLDCGFPGEMRVETVFTFTAAHEIVINYRAVCDQDTLVNLTNHAYFNLHATGDILGHTLRVPSETITEVDEGLIPTGNLVQLDGLPLDLRGGPRIGDAIAAQKAYPPMENVNGFDFNYMLPGEGMREAAELYDPASGRVMRCATTEPCMQVYSGQGLNAIGHGGQQYYAYSGVALETQHAPDAVHHPEFETTLLRAGEIFESHTVYSFSVR